MKVWIILFASSFVACVNQAEDAASDSRTKTSSQIQPRALFVSGKSRAEVLKPGPLQVIAAPYTFYFSTAGTAYGSVLIFKDTGVSFTVQDFAAGNLAARCVAGASSLASHPWSGATLRLDTTASGLTEFYKCDASNPNEPLSKTQKMGSDDPAFPAGNYVWLVMGYDKSGALTHTSGLEKFSK